MIALTIQQAATACSVDPTTVKRRLNRGQFPTAYKDSGGRWMIPTADLLAAGLHLQAPGATPQTNPPPPPQGAPAQPLGDVEGIREALAAAELRAAIAEQHAQGLEAVLAERAATVAALTEALRLAGMQLEAAPVAVVTQEPPPRRWWGRRTAGRTRG